MAIENSFKICIAFSHAGLRWAKENFTLTKKTLTVIYLFYLK